VYSIGCGIRIKNNINLVIILDQPFCIQPLRFQRGHLSEITIREYQK
ncbi:6239_t:CDS:2, partial [Funneliformis geosporum]